MFREKSASFFDAEKFVILRIIRIFAVHFLR